MSDVDPEVERLARVVHSADWGTPVEECHAGTDDYRIAAAVLANLRERYILVPRMSWGFQPTQEWPPEVTSAPLSAQNGPDDSQTGGGSCSDS